MHKNNPDDFPELKSHKLEHWAKFWIEKYPDIPIVRIVLYEYRSKSKYTDHLKMRNPYSQEPQYVVIFEVHGLDLDHYMGGWRPYMEGRLRCIKGKRYYTEGGRLYNIPWRDFIYKMDNIPPSAYPEESIFICGYNGFEQVHKEILPVDLLKMTDEERKRFLKRLYRQWSVIALPPEGPLPHYVDKKVSKVLWGAENKIVEDIQPSDNLIDDNAVDTNQISIDKLEVCAENDEEISIKEPGKRKIPFRYDHSYFKHRTPGSKDWKCLIGTLRTPTYRYHNVKGTDKRRSRLNRINKKLIALIKNNFNSLKTPEDGKLYELCKGDDSGIYRFRFKIVPVRSESKGFDKLRKKFEKIPKENLLPLYLEMRKEHDENPKEHLKKRIDAAETVLREKYWYNKKELNDLYQEWIDTYADKAAVAQEFSNHQEEYRGAINRDADDNYDINID